MAERERMATPIVEKDKQLHSKDEDCESCIQNPNTEKKKKKIINVPLYLKVPVVLLALLVIMLLAVLLSLVIEWQNKRINALQNREQDVCVPKHRLHNCTGELTQQDTLCCGKTSHVIDALVKQFSSQKFKDSAGARMLSEQCNGSNTEEMQSKHVAKFEGLDMDKINQQGEGTVVFWDTSEADRITQGVEYDNSCIKIKKEGQYFLYTQIKLSRNRKLERSPVNGPFRLSMYRFRKNNNPTKREIILESSNSECDIFSDEEMTSSIGAVFELKEGDAISVETSHPKYLVDSRESNYFGLYSIGNYVSYNLK